MLLTDDAGLAEQARHLATQARQPVVHYEHTEIGYNYRLSNLLAALGRAQLSRLDSMIARRRQWRDEYRAFFSKANGIEIFGGDDTEDNCWLTSVVVDPNKSSVSADQLRRRLNDASVETRPLWKPMHMQPVFADALRLTNGSSELLFERGLTLPSGSAMSRASMDHVLDALSNALAAR